MTTNLQAVRRYVHEFEIRIGDNRQPVCANVFMVERVVLASVHQGLSF